MIKRPRIHIEKAKLTDAPRVGELLWLVDPYIYPVLFGTEENARQSMSWLMHLENSPFSVDCTYVARTEDGEIVGVMVAYRKNFDGLPDERTFCEGLPPSAHDVFKRYLVPMVKDLDGETTYVAALAVKPNWRQLGIGGAMLDHTVMLTRRGVTLDVLEDNERAIRLYEHHEFVVVGEMNGYAYGDLPPRVLNMKRA